MNCKPGDLAVIVKSYNGHEGKIVRCIKLTEGIGFYGSKYVGWEIYPALETKRGVKCVACDSQLRPIRDQPGTDEMIRIAGKPNKEKVDG